MLVAEAPGDQEVLKGIPFMGAGGAELDRMLQEAGLFRGHCFLTSVCRVRPPGNKIEAFVALKKKDITAAHVRLRDKFVLPVVMEGFKLLIQEIELCQPQVIIPFGNLAMWALTGKWGITSWRGSLLPVNTEEMRSVL